MLYSTVLYGQFRINIFDYSETADFLLSALKNPVALLAVVLQAVMFACLIAYGTAVSNRRARLTNALIARTRSNIQSTERRLSEDPGIDPDETAARIQSVRDRLESDIQEHEARVSQINRRLRTQLATTFAFGFIATSIIVPFVSASIKMSSIKEGKNPVVDVRYRSFSGSEGQVTVPGLQLIGATQKAAYFYDATDKRTLVIPQAQLVSIEVPD